MKCRKAGSAQEAEAPRCLFIFDCKDLMSVFSCNAWPLNDWELIQTTTAPVAAKIPLKSCYLSFLLNPDNWVMRMQKMWSHLGKRWCKQKEVSPGRQRCGRGDDKARHCHCWDEFRAEKCFWNAYVIPHPRLIVQELRSICCSKDSQWAETKQNMHLREHCHSRARISQLKWRSVINYIFDSLGISLSGSVLAV